MLLKILHTRYYVTFIRYRIGLHYPSKHCDCQGNATDYVKLGSQPRVASGSRNHPSVVQRPRITRTGVPEGHELLVAYIRSREFALRSFEDPWTVSNFGRLHSPRELDLRRLSELSKSFSRSREGSTSGRLEGDFRTDFGIPL